MESLIGLGLRILLALVSFYMAYKALNLYRSYPTNTVIVVALIFLSTGIVGLLQSYAFTVSFLDGVSRSAILDGLLAVIISFLLILFTSYYEDTKPNSFKLVFSTIFATLTVTAFVSNTDLIPGEPRSPFFILITIPYFIFVFTIIYRSIRRISTDMEEKQLNVTKFIVRYITVIYLGLMMFYNLVIIYQIVSSSVDESVIQAFQLLSAIVPALIFILANLILYRAFVIPENPALLLPQKFEKFILMGPEGTAFFEYDFHQETEIDGMLLSGALTAITTVMKEATNIAGSLESVKLGGQYMMVEVVDDKIGVLISEISARFLFDALELAMDQIADIELQVTSVSREETKKLTNIIETSFGKR